MLTREESELLSAFLDKELRGDKLAMVRDRLAISPSWRSELEQLKRSKNLMAALPEISAPIDLVERIGRAAEARVTQRLSVWESLRAAFVWSPWLTSGSVLAATVFSTMLYINHQASATLPLEPLLAAHAQGQSQGFFPQRIEAASEYSSDYKSDAAS